MKTGQCFIERGQKKEAVKKFFIANEVSSRKIKFLAHNLKKPNKFSRITLPHRRGLIRFTNNFKKKHGDLETIPCASTPRFADKAYMEACVKNNAKNANTLYCKKEYR